MNSDQAKTIIKRNVDCKQFLEKTKKSGMYNCPYCGSGMHNDYTGALKVYDTNTWTCHACHMHGDVIDLYQNKTGCSYAVAIRELAKQAGISEPIDGTTAEDAVADFSDIAPSFNGTVKNAAPAKQADYTEYYERCRRNLIESKEAQEYFEKRGLDYFTALSVGIGFDPQADPANAPGAMGNEYKPHPAPRVIVPTGPAHYVGRRIDNIKEFDKVNSKGGTPGIFQAESLYYDAEAVFVVEGWADALSLMQVGKYAIALNSTNNGKLLWEMLEKKPTKSTLILCYDHDSDPNTAERVRKQEQELKEHLKRLNVSFVSGNICGPYKDANEALVKDREVFIQAVQKAVVQTATRPDNTLTYLEEVMAGEIAKFKSVTQKTGFSNLDAKARGLYSGLYVLAAISSLGKTTLALQTADQLAAAGNDVLFFSMEQSRLEMVSKSLARLTAQKDMKTAVNALSIRQGYGSERVLNAITAYREQIGNRLSIVEGNFNCDVGYISEYIRRYIAQTGEKPVIFIDYLQILQPAADGKSRNSKKDEIDMAVTELKRLSRELDLTVIVISSLNRANYMTPFAFESLKESGGIEYTADVVWGLQLACLDESLFDGEGKIKEKRKRINEAKEENPRKIKLVCLKNRYGISHYEVNFTYYPEYDLFVPAPDTMPTGRTSKGK